MAAMATSRAIHGLSSLTAAASPASLISKHWSSPQAARPAPPSSRLPGARCQAAKEGGWGVQLPFLLAREDKEGAAGEEDEREVQGTRRFSVGSFLRGSDEKVEEDQQEQQQLLQQQEVAVDAADEGESEGDWYFNVTGFPFPLRPFLRRKTYRYEIDAGSIWTFEQEQGLGFSNVTTNVRMTVIRLASGGLFVHAPIAPTKECLRLLSDLGLPVQHIVLPTFAYEHKIFAGPFARKFPGAKVWSAPQQWSWPINLPLPFLGLFGAKTLVQADDGSPPADWPREIEFKTFASPEVGIGPYVEVAFLHRPSRTLLLTDAIIVVPRQPPQVVRTAALLSAAANGLAVRVLSRGREVEDVTVEDTEEFRALGWQRMVLQILFFGPGNLLEPSASFDRICGKMVVSPVVKTLVFEKVPDQALAWIASITSDWSFSRIIPCHFAAPIAATPADLKQAFAFLEEIAQEKPPVPLLSLSLPLLSLPSLPSSLLSLFGGGKSVGERVEVATSYAEEDLVTLKSLDSILVSLGAVKKTGDP